MLSSASLACKAICSPHTEPATEAVKGGLLGAQGAFFRSLLQLQQGEGKARVLEEVSEATWASAEQECQKHLASLATEHATSARQARKAEDPPQKSDEAAWLRAEEDCLKAFMDMAKARASRVSLARKAVQEIEQRRLAQQEALWASAEEECSTNFAAEASRRAGRVQKAMKEVEAEAACLLEEDTAAWTRAEKECHALFMTHMASRCRCETAQQQCDAQVALPGAVEQEEKEASETVQQKAREEAASIAVQAYKAVGGA